MNEKDSDYTMSEAPPCDTGVWNVSPSSLPLPSPPAVHEDSVAAPSPPDAPPWSHNQEAATNSHAGQSSNHTARDPVSIIRSSLLTMRQRGPVSASSPPGVFSDDIDIALDAFLQGPSIASIEKLSSALQSAVDHNGGDEGTPSAEEVFVSFPSRAREESLEDLKRFLQLPEDEGSMRFLHLLRAPRDGPSQPERTSQTVEIENASLKILETWREDLRRSVASPGTAAAPASDRRTRAYAEAGRDPDADEGGAGDGKEVEEEIELCAPIETDVFRSFGTVKVDNFFGESDDTMLSGYIPSGIHPDDAGIDEGCGAGVDCDGALTEDALMMGLWAPSPSPAKGAANEAAGPQRDQQDKSDTDICLQYNYFNHYSTPSRTDGDTSSSQCDPVPTHLHFDEVVIMGDQEELDEEEDEERAAGSSDAEGLFDVGEGAGRHSPLPERALQLLRPREYSAAVAVEGEEGGDDTVYSFEEE